jgi:DNA processing protein
MAAISDATVIVEASDTSGTLTQARACLAQRRPLFILRSCFEDPALVWPKKLFDNNKGKVFIIDTTEQLVKNLETYNG